MWLDGPYLNSSIGQLQCKASRSSCPWASESSNSINCAAQLVDCVPDRSIWHLKLWSLNIQLWGLTIDQLLSLQMQHKEIIWHHWQCEGNSVLIQKLHDWAGTLVAPSAGLQKIPEFVHHVLFYKEVGAEVAVNHVKTNCNTCAQKFVQIDQKSNPRKWFLCNFVYRCDLERMDRMENKA